jgi:hypothetical protein
LLGALALLAILAVAAGWSATPARADGDPASDVLAAQQLFLPQDAAVPERQQLRLAGLLQESARSGYPIRVALIASSTDLGSITELWRQPQNYAQFLGQELSLVYRGPLLVVMPAGFGLYNFARPLTVKRSILAGVSLRGGLGSATLTAIRSLAAAAGHRLAPPAVGTTSAGAGGGSTLPWIAFITGAILVAMAWAASLHTRPLRLAGKKARPLYPSGDR